MSMRVKNTEQTRLMTTADNRPCVTQRQMSSMLHSGPHPHGVWCSFSDIESTFEYRYNSALSSSYWVILSATLAMNTTTFNSSRAVRQKMCHATHGWTDDIQTDVNPIVKTPGTTNTKSWVLFPFFKCLVPIWKRYCCFKGSSTKPFFSPVLKCSKRSRLVVPNIINK